MHVSAIKSAQFHSHSNCICHHYMSRNKSYALSFGASLACRTRWWLVCQLLSFFAVVRGLRCMHFVYSRIRKRMVWWSTMHTIRVLGLIPSLCLNAWTVSLSTSFYFTDFSWINLRYLLNSPGSKINSHELCAEFSIANQINNWIRWARF